MNTHIALAVMWLVASLLAHDSARKAHWRGKTVLRYAWLTLMVVELFFVVRECNKAWEAFNDKDNIRTINDIGPNSGTLLQRKANVLRRTGSKHISYLILHRSRSHNT